MTKKGDHWDAGYKNPFTFSNFMTIVSNQHCNPLLVYTLCLIFFNFNLYPFIYLVIHILKLAMAKEGCLGLSLKIKTYTIELKTQYFFN